MRIEDDWIGDPGTQTIFALLEEAGHQCWFVGGCVRNALLGLPVTDMDITTDARPEQVTGLAEARGLRVLPTGIEHGTVTVMSDGPHEVTTFRRDVATDGRRATIAYSDSIEEDAARRDFTMNALYADARGEVRDPLGGLPDLLARRVRFIGDPAARIREDGLRVLRFFRFSAIYGRPDAALDPEGLAAVTEAAAALEPVSRERIGAEMRKLLGAERPAAAVMAMAESAVLSEVLADARAELFPALAALEAATGVPPRWLRRLAALGPGERADALRLSRVEARELERIRTCLTLELPEHAAAERYGPGVAEDAALLRAARGRPLPEGWRADIAAGVAARFPVSSADLLPRYGAGPRLGAALDRLHAEWVDSRFTLDRDRLLAIDRDGKI